MANKSIEKAQSLSYHTMHNGSWLPALSVPQNQSKLIEAPGSAKDVWVDKWVRGECLPEPSIYTLGVYSLEYTSTHSQDSCGAFQDLKQT